MYLTLAHYKAQTHPKTSTMSQVVLGSYGTAEAAARAYDEAELSRWMDLQSHTLASLPPPALNFPLSHYPPEKLQQIARRKHEHMLMDMKATA